MEHLAPRQSLSRKLPLLISALLLALIASFTGVAYREISRTLLAAAAIRMNSTAQLLAQVFEESARRLRTETERMAADSAVRKFIDTRDVSLRSAAEAALSRSFAQAPQVLGVELRDRTGKRRVLWVDGPSTKIPPFLRAPGANALLTVPRQTTVGPFMLRDTVVFYQVAAPVVVAPGDTIGFVAQYRTLPGPQGAQLVKGLIAADAGVLVGNASGNLWNDLSSVVPGPQPNAKGRYAGSYTAPDGSKRIGAAVEAKRTPWRVWVDVPVSEVLAPANRFLRNALIAAAILVLVGGLGAMVVSRRITGPLREVTGAAQGIASGDYSRRVKADRDDEIGLLAASFNSMAEQVEDSRRDMEGRVAARTIELETAVNKLHETQEALVRREKLAILGQLAGGVGHELRNPLGVMTNAIYYLNAMLRDAPDNVKEYLGILRTQVGLSEKIVGDLLDFARVKQPQLEMVQVPSLVKDQLDRVGPLDGIAVRCDFPSDLPAVHVDRVQMGQVVLNLISNAVQAMDGGNNTLTIRARTNGDKHVVLDVVDTGTGMTPEELAKIFDPLYTTKARGIGLGLSVSRSLAQANGGDISAESKPGEGSTVTVSMPFVAESRVA